MQQWYEEHIISSTRRQLILIICSNDEIKRSTNGISSQRTRHSFRSSLTISTERLPRAKRRPDKLYEDENDDIHMSLIKSKSDSKLRCLTTKRKHSIDLRSTKSETMHLHQPFMYPKETAKLDYIMKSFESIEINDENQIDQYRQSLKILSNFDTHQSYFTVQNLKQFKESCCFHSVASIK